jgi:hypothetical protein
MERVLSASGLILAFTMMHFGVRPFLYGHASLTISGRRMNEQQVYRWHNLKTSGLEVLRLETSSNCIRARGEIIDAGDSPSAVSYDWTLDNAWQTRSLHIRVRARESYEVSILRIAEQSWRIDGCDRQDFSQCEEIDLSITPFSNTLALLRFGLPPGGPVN